MAHEHVKGILSAGEVILIDTRQHWMALVRFALKPILLIGLAVLLVLINQWLQFDGLLAALNDLIHIILVVAVLVAIVWLPIDVVRWYSRHYVLTNRRAMRMDGVLRKRSFDSSLEQINDIGLAQSVFGRALGYADLTLYTASDTANDSYEQLLDGPRFKKAVLDAKEGMRSGAPLAALTDGFIVKGGTNIASMKADGRLEEAANAESATTQTAAPPPRQQDTPVEQVTAEMLTQRSDPGAASPPPVHPGPFAAPPAAPVPPTYSAPPPPQDAAPSAPPAADPAPFAAPAAEPAPATPTESPSTSSADSATPPAEGTDPAAPPPLVAPEPQTATYPVAAPPSPESAPAEPASPQPSADELAAAERQAATEAAAWPAADTAPPTPSESATDDSSSDSRPTPPGGSGGGAAA